MGRIQQAITPRGVLLPHLELALLLEGPNEHRALRRHVLLTHLRHCLGRDPRSSVAEIVQRRLHAAADRSRSGSSRQPARRLAGVTGGQEDWDRFGIIHVLSSGAASRGASRWLFAGKSETAAVTSYPSLFRNSTGKVEEGYGYRPSCSFRGRADLRSKGPTGPSEDQSRRDDEWA